MTSSTRLRAAVPDIFFLCATKKTMVLPTAFLPIGATGFEPATFAPPVQHSSQAELRPDKRKITANSHSPTANSRARLRRGQAISPAISPVSTLFPASPAPWLRSTSPAEGGWAIDPIFCDVFGVCVFWRAWQSRCFAVRGRIAPRTPGLMPQMVWLGFSFVYRRF